MQLEIEVQVAPALELFLHFLHGAEWPAHRHNIMGDESFFETECTDLSLENLVISNIA